jgi:hypothetical protein
VQLLKAVVPAILLVSSLVFAQHSTVSSPPPSPPPSISSSASSATHSSSPSPSPAVSSPAPSHVSSSGGTSNSNAGSNVVHAAPSPHESDVLRDNAKVKPPVAETKVAKSFLQEGNAKKDTEKETPEPDLRRHICFKGPCPQPEPDLRHRVCLNGLCPCPTGMSAGKDGSCAPPPNAKVVVQQACLAGEVWNGNQCMMLSSQQCMPGQTRVGSSCRADCAISTTGAQTDILELRSARLRKNDACRIDPRGQECLQAEGHYSTVLSEYRTFLAGVPTECRGQLPDPSAI